MSENQTSVESWDGLLKNYLKAENLKESNETFVCVGVSVDGENMDLNLERNEGQEKFVFGLNRTNMSFLKSNKISAPKEVIGKVLTLEKVKARNPTTKQEVDSLRINKIE